jgi:hypothetical protein
VDGESERERVEGRIEVVEGVAERVGEEEKDEEEGVSVLVMEVEEFVKATLVDVVSVAEGVSVVSVMVNTPSSVASKVGDAVVVELVTPPGGYGHQ